MGHMVRVSFNPRKRTTSKKEALRSKKICMIQPLYLLLFKLQLTICYVTCVKPEFRSLVQYDVTLQISRKSIGIPYTRQCAVDCYLVSKVCPQLNERATLFLNENEGYESWFKYNCT